MTSSLDNVEAITVFSDNVPASREFYTRVFAAPILFEDEVSVALRIGAIVINVLARSEAPALIAPEPIAEAGAAASVMLTVNVPDVDAACAAVREHGVELVNGPVDRPWGRRTAVFLDPSGLPWEVAQELG
ncbi:VOC family protein [Salinibacterium sp. SWN167]|uniref:VOC family protein n=1 Tax=Salinibacterium sp. SWN167 TaxID=2792054 RepID=UPI0018CE81C0|nr:VOC family protein [Salinibacterium sp. SWN167]MBH0084269.1 VOC family protein [Salinibacterium sp. SWN167]